MKKKKEEEEEEMCDDSKGQSGVKKSTRPLVPHSTLHSPVVLLPLDGVRLNY
jgi:hypothetical protein